MPARFGDRFAAREPLAEGGFAVVWRAVDERTGREVAVKALKPAAFDTAGERTRFENEARVTARLAHPSIVRVIDSGSDGEGAWIAYELVDGRDLGAMVENGPLPLATAITAGVQVAQALACAHAAGVLHRDIKPGNVLERQGRFVVTDFGIAKWASGTQVRTKTGMVLGTPAYMAPEQIRGEPLTAAVDIYALGCVMYHLVTGALPFVGDTPVKVLEMHLYAEPPRASAKNPQVPAELDAVIAQALAKDPAQRFASADAMAQALEAAGRAAAPSRARTVKASRPAPSVPVAPRLRLGPLIAGGAVVALGLGLALGRRAAPPEPPAPPSVTSPTAAPVAAPPDEPWLEGLSDRVNDANMHFYKRHPDRHVLRMGGINLVAGHTTKLTIDGLLAQDEAELRALQRLKNELTDRLGDAAPSAPAACLAALVRIYVLEFWWQIQDTRRHEHDRRVLAREEAKAYQLDPLPGAAYFEEAVAEVARAARVLARHVPSVNHRGWAVAYEVRKVAQIRYKTAWPAAVDKRMQRAGDQLMRELAALEGPHARVIAELLRSSWEAGRSDRASAAPEAVEALVRAIDAARTLAPGMKQDMERWRRELVTEIELRRRTRPPGQNRGAGVGSSP